MTIRMSQSFELAAAPTTTQLGHFVLLVAALRFVSLVLPMAWHGMALHSIALLLVKKQIVSGKD